MPCTCEICSKDSKRGGDYIIYRFQLSEDALKSKRLKKHNQGVERTEDKIFYVGMTARELSDRIEQHQSQECKKSTIWGKKYMISDTGRKIKKITSSYLKDKFGSGRGTAIKKTEFVTKQEKKEAEILREKGHWVYQA